MALSRSILKNFAKVTNDRATKTNTNTYVYATAVVGDDGSKYVKMDGSNQVTPVSRLTDIGDGDRVMVSIQDHKAVVMGNLSYPPSARDIKVAMDLGEANLLEIEQVRTEILEANYAKFEELDAAYAKITEIDVLNARIDTIEAGSITTEYLNAEVAKLGYVTATQIEAQYVKAEELEAKVGVFGYVKTDELEATKADITELFADYAKITELEVEVARINILEVETATIEQLHATKAEIDELLALKATIDQLKALEADIDELQSLRIKVASIEADYATIVMLNAAKADIDVLEAGYANIETLLSGNVSSGSIQSIVLNSSNATIANGTIKSAMIESLTFDKITGFDINTTNLTIHSNDGKSKWNDNTIQISDANRVRVQIGKDASNDYSMSVWDASGKLIWDALGATENTIQRKIIRNDIVADDAAISGSKLDINSVVRSLNGATETLSSTSVIFDDINQTFNASFKSMETTVANNLEQAKAYVDGEIDGLKIGGRNLLIRSKASKGYLSSDGTGGLNATTQAWDLTSDWIDVSNIDSIVISLYDSFEISGTGMGRYCLYDANKTCINTTGFNPRTPTSVVVDTSNATYFRITALCFDTYRYKVEKGNIATDWTPAPEDTQNQIDELTTVTETHTTNISVIQGQISSLISKDTEIENALGDKVTTSQYNSIKDTVDSHTQTIGSHTTQLNTQSGQISSVSSKVTTIEQNLDIWSVELTSTQSDLTALTSRVKTAETSITALQGEIALKVSQTEVDAAIDGIEIGGRNLLINSTNLTPRLYMGSTITHESNVSVTEWNTNEARRAYGTGGTNLVIGILSGNISNGDKHYTGGIYTLSVYFKNNGSTTINVYANGLYKFAQILPGEAKRVILTGEGKTTSLIQFNIQTESVGDVFDFCYWRPKVERGTKATDWTPAPEDVDSAIDTVDAKFANYSTTTQMNSAIELSKSSILSTVSSTYTTKAELNTVSGKVTSLETWKTEASQKITKDGIIATVGNYYAYETDLQKAENRITTAESTITQHANLISLRVEKAGVISAINQTAETIKIEANKVELSGYVTFSSLTSSGTTAIDGSRITTGKISADRIDVNNLFAGTITINKDGTASKLSIENYSITWVSYGYSNGSMTSTSSVGTFKSLVFSEDIKNLIIPQYVKTDSVMSSYLSVSTAAYIKQAYVEGTVYANDLMICNTIQTYGDLTVVGSIYEGGTALSSKYAAAGRTHSYLPLSGGTINGSLTVTGDITADGITGEPGTTNHCIIVGEPYRDKVEIYEWGGEFNLWQSQDGVNTKIMGVSPSAFTYNSNTVLTSANYASYCAPASHTHSYLPLTGGQLSGHLLLLEDVDLYMRYNSTSYKVVESPNNGNILLNACGGGLYLGYSNTAEVNMRNAKALKWLNTSGSAQQVLVMNSSNQIAVGNSSYGVIIRGSTINSNVSITVSSDRNAKHDITDISQNMLDAFMDLRFVQFRYNENSEKLNVGLIYQEAEGIFEKHGIYDFAGIQKPFKHLSECTEEDIENGAHYGSIAYDQFQNIHMAVTQKHHKYIMTLNLSMTNAEQSIEQLKHQYLSQEERMQYIIQQLQQAQAEIGQLQTQLKALA